MGKFLGWVVVVGICVGCSAVTIPAQEKKAEEKDLSGVWDGDAGGDKEWGEVRLKSTEDGYIGTYSDTFNRQLGSLTFKKVAEGKYKGLWWESSLKHHGSVELEVSKDGRTITVNWKATDGRTKSAKSTWKSKGE